MRCVFNSLLDLIAIHSGSFRSKTGVTIAHPERECRAQRSTAAGSKPSKHFRSLRLKSTYPSTTLVLDQRVGSGFVPSGVGDGPNGDAWAMSWVGAGAR
jgi:hypothetical protein